jgi:hypothetical protein
MIGSNSQSNLIALCTSVAKVKGGKSDTCNGIRLMREPAPGTDERRKCIQEWVFQSPAFFGRLLAVSELHNPLSRRYEHYLCRDFPDNGDSILRQIHVEVFAEWLNFGLEQQVKDIRLWLHWLGRTRDGADLLKRVAKRANSLIPQQYRREPERTLFLSDLRLVVAVVDLR